MTKKNTNREEFIIGLIQMSVSKDADINLSKAIERIGQAAKKGAQVICLPELFRSQYFCQQEDAKFFDLAEPIPGPTTKALSSVARKHRVALIVPVFERRAAGIYYNSTAILDTDGTLAGVYRKMHIPDDPAYYEKFYFTPGDLGFQAFNTKYGTNRRAHLLGSMVSGSRTHYVAARRFRTVLSDCNRMASE